MSAVVADEQSLEPVEPGEGALGDPAVAAETGALLGLAACDLGFDPALLELATVSVLVVAAIGGDAVGSRRGRSGGMKCGPSPCAAVPWRLSATSQRPQPPDLAAVGLYAFPVKFSHLKRAGKRRGGRPDRGAMSAAR
jgi:hypothetical protein